MTKKCRFIAYFYEFYAFYQNGKSFDRILFGFRSSSEFDRYTNRKVELVMVT